MKLDRRGFLQQTGVTLASLSVLRDEGRAAAGQTKIGMCEWNLGRSCDPEMIPIAKEVGVGGIQIDVGTDPDNIAVRDPSIRERYRELAKLHEITIHSVAAGWILNRIPLKSEPQSAVYVIDALDAAATLGAGNILVAFFSNGDLRMKDSTGQFRRLSDDPSEGYELDTQGVSRVVEALRQIVPRAEDSGVIIGLETTLTATQTLEIIDRIGSQIVRVYYDVGNSTRYGYNVPAEIRMLGNDAICEIHLKDTESGLLGATEGIVDFQGIAGACRAIGYNKWYVLETSGREGRFLEDTRSNIAYVTKAFA